MDAYYRFERGCHVLGSGRLEVWISAVDLELVKALIHPQGGGRSLTVIEDPRDHGGELGVNGPTWGDQLTATVIHAESVNERSGTVVLRAQVLIMQLGWVDVDVTVSEDTMAVKVKVRPRALTDPELVYVEWPVRLGECSDPHDRSMLEIRRPRYFHLGAASGRNRERVSRIRPWRLPQEEDTYLSGTAIVRWITRKAEVTLRGGDATHTLVLRRLDAQLVVLAMSRSFDDPRFSDEGGEARARTVWSMTASERPTGWKRLLSRGR